MTTAITSVQELSEHYYELIDTLEPDRLAQACALMTEDVRLTFANAPTVTGREAAAGSIQVVLDRCTGIKHTVLSRLESPRADGTIDFALEIRIHYNLKNGRTVDIPGSVFGTVREVDTANGPQLRFTEQRLYGDLTDVFAD
ncbi:nuclear transport factor 2 family protein [Nocardia paucivorans]|uniref:nuclear transport factor 2 family protein n=1 Tax=Nocardia paucivorans TaxID=114259 RepID=UPI00031C7D23|nr:nuclear transport factor 2 family protein [Nocardia paucivorans]